MHAVPRRGVRALPGQHVVRPVCQWVLLPRGQLMCVACAWLDDTWNCSSCVPGKYSTALGATAPAVCSDCEAWTFSTGRGRSNASTCAACPVGKFSDAGAQECSPCCAGTYNSATSVVGNCSLCDAGTFSAGLGANSSNVCSSCGPNTFSDQGWATSEATACEACASGLFSPSGALACNACPAFSDAVQNRSGVVCVCQAGYFANASTCLPCRSSADSPLCTPCAAGTYGVEVAATNASACFTCAAGSFSNESATA